MAVMRIAKACATGLLLTSFLWPVAAGSSPWTPPLPQTKPRLSQIEGHDTAQVELASAMPLPMRKPALTTQAPSADEDLPPVDVSSVKGQWNEGLAAWRSQNYKKTFDVFATLVKSPGDKWTHAGAAFWAARAADRMDERRVAKGYLQLASQNVQTFYGQLAAQIMRKEPDLSFGMFKTLPHDIRGDVQGDSALIHAIIMQESRFNGHARSPMGARGLMQLMPATAQHLDRGGYKNADQLYDEAYNVRLGSRYVQQLADNPIVAGQAHLLLAAYNGGPANLDRWLKAMPDSVVNDPFLLVEAYPSSETRAFVERVMANMWVYDRMLNHRTSPSLKQLAGSF